MKRLKTVLKWLALSVVALVVLVGLILGTGWWYFHPSFQRTDGVVYGRRHEKNLTLDVLRPDDPNGIGVALMVSGGWRSSKAGEFPGWMAAPLLRKGYTVFAVCHISQPESTVMEIVEDVNRAIRFIRHHAKDYGIDPSRIGVTGGSAGGHLSLMLATRGAPGPAESKDPVDRETSAVQAVAIFYPVTDLLNLGTSTENLGDGGPPKSFVKAFGPQSTNLAAWKVIGRETSPLYYVNSNLPPTLIYHGDADTLTPLDQSQRYQTKAREMGRTVELVVHPGGKHGWLTMVFDIRKFGEWFDRYLVAEESGGAAEVGYSKGVTAGSRGRGSTTGPRWAATTDPSTVGADSGAGLLTVPGVKGRMGPFQVIELDRAHPQIVTAKGGGLFGAKGQPVGSELPVGERAEGQARGGGRLFEVNQGDGEQGDREEEEEPGDFTAGCWHQRVHWRL